MKSTNSLKSNVQIDKWRENNSLLLLPLIFSSFSKKPFLIKCLKHLIRKICYFKVKA